MWWDHVTHHLLKLPKTLFILKSPLHRRYVPLLPLVFLWKTLGYMCLPVKECSRERQAFWRFKKANPRGSCRGQQHHAHFKVWVKPLIERLPPSKHPLSPASDVTGHFHTPTLFNTLLLVLHWSCVGRNPHTSAGSSVSYSYGWTRPKILWKKNILIVAVEAVVAVELGRRTVQITAAGVSYIYLALLAS